MKREFGKIYIEWVGYLKKRGVYPKYMLDYARSNEYLSRRSYLLLEGSYGYAESEKLINTPHNYFNTPDHIIPNISHCSFDDLRKGMEYLMWYIPLNRKKYDWSEWVVEFGVEYGYYEKPKDFYWYIETSSASTVTQTPARRERRERNDAHAGQWYDRFYRRGTNNINNRWRR